MNFLIKERLVRFIGVSNFNVEQMKEGGFYSKKKKFYLVRIKVMLCLMKKQKTLQIF
jgi:diketogulonate reductase-like aldo/keto reductase